MSFSQGFKFSALDALVVKGLVASDDIYHNGMRLAQTGALLVTPESGSGFGVSLAQSAVAVSVPADTTEDILQTITLPAGAMGANGRLRITTQWTTSGVAGSRTPAIRFGGIGGTSYNPGSLNNAQSSFKLVIDIANRNSASSQVGGSDVFTNNAGIGAWVAATGAINTAIAQTILITGQKVAAADVMTLESYLVELFYGT